LLLYTDGVTEAENADHAPYGHTRLANALAKLPPDDAQSIVAAVIADVRGFVGEAEQTDDVTVLALRRRADDAGG